MFEKDKDITSFTTFGVKATTKLFAEYSSVAELKKIINTNEYRTNEVLHIGAGSNLLFIGKFNGLILHSKIKGITEYQKNNDTTYVIAGAGEKWSDFVDWCIEHNLSGIENLAHIPGEVGASPIQNVGAYGVEAKDIIFNVEAYDRKTNKIVTITNKDCRFAYRDSIFKNESKGRYFILRVSFKLKKSTIAENLEYGPLKNLKDSLCHTPSIKEIKNEVTKIRKNKLPEPDETGSAGSFFKNPIVNKHFFQKNIAPEHPDIPTYPVDENHIKIPAGWLIEHAGLKGATSGGAEIYPRQCLVIANKNNASANDIVNLSQMVIDKVHKKYNILLHPEVNFIDTSINVTVLGSGTSKGVPEIGCKCNVCQSADNRDKRLRASVLIKTHSLNILIDTTPDFRTQALKHNINNLDAVLLTHSHYDHVGGIDDLRTFCADHNLPIYAREDVASDLKKRNDYCFRQHPYPGVPQFDLHIIEPDKKFKINGLEITPINVMHASLPILGYRIGDFAYITDAKSIADDEIEKLSGCKTIIVNALRYDEHFSHFTVNQAIQLINKIKPEQAYLTHMNHDIGLHCNVEKQLPENIHLCYDDMELHIN